MVAALWLSSYRVAAESCDRLEPWARLEGTGKAFLGPVPLSLTAGAVLAPVVMIPSGADHELRWLSQRQWGGRPNAEPVSIWAPYVLTGSLIALDAIVVPLQKCEWARPTSAMLQALVLTAGTVGVLKWVTSRAWPNDRRDASSPDRPLLPETATTFYWFDWERGYAWPSGHTAVMFAVASALAGVTEYRHWVGYVAYAAAVGVGAGMWFGDHHWGSDIVSGGLLGFSIGNSVATSFRGDAHRGPTGASWSLSPWSGAGITGLSATGTF